MIVAAISFFISRYFHPYSIYTTPLYKKGIRFRSEKEKYFVQQVSLGDLVETNFVQIRPGMTLRDLIGKIAQSKRNLFPVVDENKKLLGIIYLDDIREYLLNTELYDVILVYEMMNIHYEFVEINTEINKVLEIFEHKKIWNLAVTRNGEYVGFVSKSIFFDKYLSLWSKQQTDNI